MFGIGGFELVLILVFGFLIVGPDKLPEIASLIGKGLNKFRTAQSQMQKVIKDEIVEPTAKAAASVSKSASDPAKSSSTKTESTSPAKRPTVSDGKVQGAKTDTPADTVVSSDKSDNATKIDADKPLNYSQRRALHDAEKAAAAKAAAASPAAAKADAAKPAAAKPAAATTKPELKKEEEK